MRRRHLRQTVTPNTPTVDFTPLIDIVFLLLIFFILTTSFQSVDKMLSAMMPSQGQVALPSTLPPPTVRIIVLPAGIERHGSEADYETRARDLRRTRIDHLVVRMGGQPITTIDLELLRHGDLTQQQRELARIQTAIHAGLAAREDPNAGLRSAAPPIEIHAWSGLPWAGVTTVFDAVRAYEAAAFGSIIKEQEDVPHARPLAFAPPRIRDHTLREDGRELNEIVHLP